jgi:hypothetical protein
MRRFTCLVLLLLAGCSKSHERTAAVQGPLAAPVGSGPSAIFAWARSDGQRMAANPELIAQAQADIAECQAEAPPRAARGVPGEPCMAERGYYVRSVQ